MPKEQTHAQKPVLIFDMNETLLDLQELNQSVADALDGAAGFTLPLASRLCPKKNKLLLE